MAKASLSIGVMAMSGGVVYGFQGLHMSPLGFELPLPLAHGKHQRMPGCAAFLASPRHSQLRLFLAQQGDAPPDETGEDAADESMNSAFDALSSLSPEDFVEEKLDDEAKLQQVRQAMQDVEQASQQTEPQSSGSSTVTEGEARLYTDMFREYEESGFSGMYEDMMTELGGPQQDDDTLQDADGIGEAMQQRTSPVDDQVAASIPDTPSVLSDMDEGESLDDSLAKLNTEEFMDTALREAIAEAKESTPTGRLSALSDVLMDDEELKKGISDIFDSADKRLRESIAEISAEQERLARERAKARMTMVQDEQDKLDSAGRSVSTLIENVEKERDEASAAMEELNRLQAQLDADPLSRLQDSSLPRRAALAGLLLFTARSGVEAVQIFSVGGDEHILPAAIQGAIAIVCGAIFFLM